MAHLARLLLRQADGANLGIREHGGRDHGVIDRRRLVVEHGLGEGGRLMDGDRGEIHPVGDIADAIDIVHRRAGKFVDHDMAVPAKVDTHLVQPEPHRIGQPAGGGHHESGIKAIARLKCTR